MCEQEKKLRSELRNFLIFLSISMIVLMTIFLMIDFYPFDSLLDCFGKPIGSDFPQFYIAGRHILDDAFGIYQSEFNLLKLREILPMIANDFNLPFWYPPFLALLFFPFSYFSYLNAFLIFSAFSLLCVVISAGILITLKPASDKLFKSHVILLSILAFPPLLENMLSGQLSAIALIILCVAISLMRSRRNYLAGVVLGFSCYKPNVLAFFIVGCLFLRPKIFFGLLTSLIVICVLSTFFLPADWMALYLSVIRHLFESQHMNDIGFKRMGLVNLIQGINLPLIASCGLLLISYLALKFKNKFGKDWSLDCLILAIFLNINSIFNPYVFIYDLLLLYPVLLFSTCFLLDRYAEPVSQQRVLLFKICFFLFFLGPYLSQFFALGCSLQFYPLLLIALLVLQVKIAFASLRRNYE